MEEGKGKEGKGRGYRGQRERENGRMVVRQWRPEAGRVVAANRGRRRKGRRKGTGG